MGNCFFHLAAVIISCVVINIFPSSGFEFFRSLVVLSASMGYDFWTIVQTGEKYSSMWYKRMGMLGVILFFLLFLLGILGLVGIFELDADMINISTTKISVVQCSIPFQWIIKMILFIPPGLVFVSDFFFKPRDIDAFIGSMQTGRVHRK